jgi:hypothetical protein
MGSRLHQNWRAFFHTQHLPPQPLFVLVQLLTGFSGPSHPDAPKGILIAEITPNTTLGDFEKTIVHLIHSNALNSNPRGVRCHATRRGGGVVVGGVKVKWESVTDIENTRIRDTGDLQSALKMMENRGWVDRILFYFDGVDDRDLTLREMLATAPPE